MFLKVCGITREEDAQAAARLGFDAIGMIFAESPRRVEPDQARAIARSVPAGLAKVGVFVNEERRAFQGLGAGFQVIEVLFVEVAATHPLAVQFGLSAEDVLGHLVFGHFQAEDRAGLDLVLIAH